MPSLAIDVAHAAGAATLIKTSFAPADRLRILLAAASPPAPFHNRVGGIWGFVRHHIAQDGLLSFWRGNFTNCLLYAPSQAIAFAAKPRLTRAFSPGATSAPSLAVHCLAGGFAGLATLPLHYQVSARSSVVRQPRGLAIVATGIFAYRALYFGVFDRYVDATDNVLQRGVLAFAAAATGAVVTHPISRVHAALATTTHSPAIKSWTGIWHVLRSLDAGFIAAQVTGSALNAGVRGGALLLLVDVFRRKHAVAQAINDDTE